MDGLRAADQQSVDHPYHHHPPGTSHLRGVQVSDTAECPALLSGDAEPVVLLLDDGGAIEVHAPDWVPIPLTGARAVRCRHCPIVHVDHDPQERQHARYQVGQA